MLADILQALGWCSLPLLFLPALTLAFPKVMFFNALTKSLITLIDSICDGLGEVIKWALPLLVLSVVVSVIALSIFGLSFTKLDELPTYLHAAVIMLGSAATLLAGQHVRVDIFYSKFAPERRAALELIGFYALIGPICLTLLWVSQGFVSGSWRTFEGSNDPNGFRAVFLLKTLVPVFAMTVLAQAGAVCARAAFLLTGNSRPKRPVHVPALFDGDAP